MLQSPLEEFLPRDLANIVGENFSSQEIVLMQNQSRTIGANGENCSNRMIYSIPDPENEDGAPLVLDYTRMCLERSRYWVKRLMREVPTEIRVHIEPPQSDQPQGYSYLQADNPLSILANQWLNATVKKAEISVAVYERAIDRPGWSGVDSAEFEATMVRGRPVWQMLISEQDELSPMQSYVRNATANVEEQVLAALRYRVPQSADSLPIKQFNELTLRLLGDIPQVKQMKISKRNYRPDRVYARIDASEADTGIWVSAQDRGILGSYGVGDPTPSPERFGVWHNLNIHFPADEPAVELDEEEIEEKSSQAEGQSRKRARSNSSSSSRRSSGKKQQRTQTSSSALRLSARKRTSK